jgi:hypothetical protein
MKEIGDKIFQKNNKIPILPVNEVQIINAVGKKICKISKQMFCKCKIGPAMIYAIFVQIENLNEKCIIGADIIQQYNTQINFNNQTVTWEINQAIHTT